MLKKYRRREWGSAIEMPRANGQRWRSCEELGKVLVVGSWVVVRGSWFVVGVGASYEQL